MIVEDHKLCLRINDFKSRIIAEYTKIGTIESENRKRETYAIQLRKEHKNQLFTLKRAKAFENSYSALSLEKDLVEARQILSKKDQSEGVAYKAAKIIRESLSNSKDPQIEVVMKLGFAPLLVSLIEFPSEKVKIEVAWSLTNIAASMNGHCKTLCELNAPIKLLNTLSTASVLLKEQAMWAIANMAAEDTKTRNQLLDQGIIKEITSIFCTSGVPMSLLKVACWTISVLCRGYPPPDYLRIRPVLPYINPLLGFTDADVVSDTLWALYYITEIPHPCTASDVAHFVPLKSLMKRLDKTASSTPILRILGNLCATLDDFPENLIDENILSIFDGIITAHNNHGEVADVCWVLSNMTSGPVANLRKIVSSGLIAKICNFVHTSSTYHTKRQGTFAIANICSEATEELILEMLPSGVLECMIDMISENDPELTQAVLKGLDNVLTTCEPVEGENEMLIQFDSLGGMQKLDSLLKVDNREVSEYANDILEKFYECEHNPVF